MGFIGVGNIHMAVMQRQFQAHITFWGASLLLLIVVAVRLQLLVAGTGGALVYALDDAYIHLAMARNFAEHGTWGINPDGFANTTSSLLWTLLLSLGLRMGWGVYTPLVLGALSAVEMLSPRTAPSKYRALHSELIQYYH